MTTTGREIIKRIGKIRSEVIQRYSTFRERSKGEEAYVIAKTKYASGIEPKEVRNYFQQQMRGIVGDRIVPTPNTLYSTTTISDIWEIARDLEESYLACKSGQVFVGLVHMSNIEPVEGDENPELRCIRGRSESFVYNADFQPEGHDVSFDKVLQRIDESYKYHFAYVVRCLGTDMLQHINEKAEKLVGFIEGSVHDIEVPVSNTKPFYLKMQWHGVLDVDALVKFIKANFPDKTVQVSGHDREVRFMTSRSVKKFKILGGHLFISEAYYRSYRVGYAFTDEVLKAAYDNEAITDESLQ